MVIRKGLLVIACATFVVASVLTAQAKSLRQTLDNLFGVNGISLDTESDHVAHFSSQSAATLGLLVQTLAQGASDYPATSTTPSFTYTYNPELKIFERSSGNFGSSFIDRSETVGAGRFNIGLAYEWVNFTELNGKPLDELGFTLTHQDLDPPSPHDPAFEDDTIDVAFNKFELQSHVFQFFGTYGITDDWDVNVIVPLFYTRLEARATATINDVANEGVHFFPGGGLMQSYSDEDDHFGVGDLLLRTKYRLAEDWATALALRIPTGSEDDFQGTGDVWVFPYGVYSYQFPLPFDASGPADGAWFRGPNEVHAYAGVDIDASNTDLTRVRYGIGVTLQVVERFAMVVDFLGSDGVTDAEISQTVPIYDEDSNAQVGTQKITETVRTDVFSLAPGIKFNPFDDVIISLAAITKLNNSGLRADTIPFGAVEWNF